MKKFSLLFLLTLSVSFAALADNPTTPPPPKGDPVPIRPITTIPRPLSLNVDIEATYVDGTLTFVFNVDLGNADIVVTNTTTGESWYDGVNGVGSTVITLSGDEGCYEIYIYTDCGDYSGTFII